MENIDFNFLKIWSSDFEKRCEDGEAWNQMSI